MKIFIADDHKMIREGLRTLLVSMAGFSVIGEAGTGADAVRMTRELQPDIVLMDINMPDLNGIDATRQIHAENPFVKILTLSMYTDRQFAQDMLKAGASGYIIKGSAFAELVEAIRTVMSGHRYLSPPIAEMLLEDYIGRLETRPVDEKEVLTSREREVLQLLSEGKSNRHIADMLCINVNTVDTHRKHISDKLGLHSIAELTKYAINKGITSLN
jgi:DNA-binding NarL/FixJ family response regulator